MAKFLSQVYTTIRGSIGGITYTANKYATLLARARVTPTQPGTTFQNQLRSAFTWANVNWRQLSDAVREGWDAYASTCPYSGPMGTYYVDGRTLFLAIFTLARYSFSRLGIPPIFVSAPPPETGWLGIQLIGVGPLIAPGTGFAITLSNPNDAAVNAIYAISYGQNATRLTWHGPYLGSSLGQVPIAESAEDDIVVPGLIEDRVYFVRIRFLQSVGPFRISPEIVVRCVAQTTVV